MEKKYGIYTVMYPPKSPQTLPQRWGGRGGGPEVHSLPGELVRHVPGICRVYAQHKCRILIEFGSKVSRIGTKMLEKSCFDKAVSKIG